MEEIEQSSYEQVNPIAPVEAVEEIDALYEGEKRKSAFAKLMEEKEEERTEEKIDHVMAAYPTPMQILTPTPISNATAIPRLQEIIIQVVEKIHTVKNDRVGKACFIVKSAKLGELSITIEHFDTAPDSFNIEISGSERIQKMCLKHKEKLSSMLKEGLPHFKCHFKPPAYRPSYKFRTKRKKAIEKSGRVVYSAEKSDLGMV